MLDHNSRYAAGSMLTAVPESTSFALLTAAGLLTLRRRR
ncbi:PEP-CTERM sorting domain-containing protein [Planctomycetales bacterium ZRK34]|nr:PEP-CTERM sorting domain-containing protein [Planctomycetales bacterium ZRK34]